MESSALDLECRKRIFEFVSAHPGVHFRELQRQLDLPVGALDYHLKYLERHEVLVSRAEGHYTRYYARDRFDPASKAVLSFLRQDLPRGIILFLLQNPKSAHGAILENFTVTGATLSYHLKRLCGEGVLSVARDGRESTYEVVDPDKVADLLITYRRSFLDELVESFVAAWVPRR
ncbi:MAG: transcriptional regulator [Euryarchaeota archaeon]|nr:transcriptional regulator [Euryarchaeota archaeon]